MAQHESTKLLDDLTGCIIASFCRHYSLFIPWIHANYLRRRVSARSHRVSVVFQCPPPAPSRVGIVLIAKIAPANRLAASLPVRIMPRLPNVKNRQWLLAHSRGAPRATGWRLFQYAAAALRRPTKNPAAGRAPRQSNGHTADRRLDLRFRRDYFKVEDRGLEPLTCSLRTNRSPN